MNDAVLTGIGTVLADDPLLTCRLPGMAKRSPLRVVLDSALRLSVSTQLVASAGETPIWVVAGESAPLTREQGLRARGVEVLRVPAADGKLDLAATFALLAARGVTRVMAETGPILAAALLDADLIDEAVLLRSDKLIGRDGIDALEGLPLEALTQSPRLARIGEEALGDDRIEILARR